ncbi:MAG: preprotein translocase subunit YajC [Eubacterium sp.]|nr:preprotein translocase subunit YajC [Eubacterium sp.]
MILASSSGSGGGMSSMLILTVALIAIMYFLMIRPQRKEQKKMEAMLSAIEIGDAVVTTSGFYGVIIDISEDDVIVEFGNNRNCRIPMKKQAIAQVEKPADLAAQKEAPEKDAKKK